MKLQKQNILETVKDEIANYKVLVESDSHVTLDIIGTIRKFLRQIGYVLSRDKENYAIKQVLKDPEIKKLASEKSELDAKIQDRFNTRYKDDHQFKQVIDDIRNGTYDPSLHYFDR